MASGSFNVTTSNRYVLGTVNWSSTPNTGGNYSEVYVEMRFSRTNTGYTTYGNGTFGLYVDGQQAVNTTSFSFTYNSNTLVVSGWFRVNHNSDGSKNLRIGASGYTDVFSINDAVAYVDLDRIPRASTLSSNVSWTAGLENLPITINRASSAFDHIVSIDVYTPNNNWAAIAWRSSVGDSTTFTFTTEENTILYQAIGGWEDRPARVRVQTWYNGNVIGETTKEGRVYGATPATPVLSDFDIGTKSVPVMLDYYYAQFSYTYEFYFGSFKKVFTGVSKNFNMTFTDDEVKQMYQQVPNQKLGQARVWASTKYNGVEINDGAPKDQNRYITLRVVNSEPTYDGGFTYADINTNTKALTNNDQYIIQGKSTVQVKLPVAKKAVAKNYATITRYEVAVNGAVQSINYSDTSDLTLNFGVVDVSTNATIVVSAIDSRGFRTSASSTILILPYALPSYNFVAERVNNFETTTNLKVVGFASPLSINSVNKNLIKSSKFKYRQVGVTTWSGEADLPLTGFPNFTASNKTVELDNTKAWEVSLTITDVLGSVTSVSTVAVGTPIMFIDTAKKSIGVNKFPSGNNALEIAGNLDVDGVITAKANQWVAQGKYSYDARNSDLFGVCALYFQTAAQNKDQGLNFLKSGRPARSMNQADYDSLSLLDNNLKINNKSIFAVFDQTSNIRLIGDMYSYASGGAIWDVWGNIKGQPTAGAGNTWSIKDADDRVRFMCGIGKGTTSSTEYKSYGGGHRFHFEDVLVASIWQQGGYQYIFKLGNGILQHINGGFEFKNSDNTGWGNVYGNWVAPSSESYKKDISVFDDSALSYINSVKPVRYQYNEQSEKDPYTLGLIAEESPDLILSSNGKGINSYSMMTLLWKAVQELDGKVENINRRITLR
ncbi:intramolecular chaperone-containing tail fiber protein [Bacillus phage Flapjack]|uniref:Intramolecular chaperone-containing tail fiber protein n=1 Tax=Bacillus phage Flapjack TaxID=1983465 RepID=A0A1X9SG79_9CAUD|nr:intramolecular chaperone-containing tail fiber protein [Bacillus phage Flapjack]